MKKIIKQINMSIKKRVAKLISGFNNNQRKFSKTDLPKPIVFRDTKNLKTKAEIYEWIKEGIGYFKEWYQPVDFGGGVIAYETVPPEWKPLPNSLNDTGTGLTKWKHIVKKHIPDIKGKRVLDVGSSSGLFSIEMARMSAREVIGIDRDVNIGPRSSNTPPVQDVVTQAGFVKKAIELLDGRVYPIKYIAHDVGKLENLNLGRFDIILALNVIYHELDNMPVVISELAKMTDHLILQTCLTHSGKLAYWSKVSTHIDALLKAGFTSIEVDAPVGYPLPIIIGRK